jgi:NAD(P)-dependent dehydrogenase (short-subunit alcohol dehydrogenase family)
MKIDLSTKVLLVTGAARGIGNAIARLAAEAGARIVAHDLPGEPELEALTRALGRERACAIGLDLAVPASAPQLFAQAVAWRGRVDVLVNNAGVYEPARIDAGFDEWQASWTRTMNINLLAPAHLCREAIRHFRSRGGGTILNIASRAGCRGDGPDYANYAASKGGLLALTRTIARGHGKEGIVAFALAPGFVRTRLNDDWFHQHGEAAARAETAIGDICTPEDIARFAVFLASEAGRHATGATFDINGASYVR